MAPHANYQFSGEGSTASYTLVLFSYFNTSTRVLEYSSTEYSSTRVLEYSSTQVLKYVHPHALFEAMGADGVCRVSFSLPHAGLAGTTSDALISQYIILMVRITFIAVHTISQALPQKVDRERDQPRTLICLS